MIGYGNSYFLTQKFGGVTPPAPQLLLDTYPNAAVAYSLRKLRTAYTGSSIRVRRSVDNAEQDIGFVGNDLDTASLLTFCGSGNGFVTTWYDQSGNARNSTQTTAINQPRIVNSGVIELENGNPTLRWHSNVVRLASYKFANPSTNWNIINVASINNVSGNNNNVLGSDGQGYFVDGIYLQSNYFAVNRASNAAFLGNGTIVNNIQFLRSYQYLSNNTAQGFLNTDTSAITSMLMSGNTFVSGTESVYWIGAYRGSGVFQTSLNLLGSISEHIIYQSNETSNMNGIKSNINTFYTIY